VTLGSQKQHNLLLPAALLQSDPASNRAKSLGVFTAIFQVDLG